MTVSYPPQQRGSLPLGLVLGVIVGAVLVMVAWFTLVPNPDSATPAPSPTASKKPSVEPTPVRTPEQSAEASPASPSTPKPTPDAPAAPTPDTSLEPVETPIPGVVTQLPAGWVTVLDSMKKDAVTPEQAVARAHELSSNGRIAVALDTDAFPDLATGYWAIVIPGSTNGNEALAVCTELGRTPRGNDCYARQIKG